MKLTLKKKLKNVKYRCKVIKPTGKTNWNILKDIFLNTGSANQ